MHLWYPVWYLVYDGTSSNKTTGREYGLIIKALEILIEWTFFGRPGDRQRECYYIREYSTITCFLVTCMPLLFCIRNALRFLKNTLFKKHIVTEVIPKNDFYEQTEYRITGFIVWKTL